MLYIFPKNSKNINLEIIENKNILKIQNIIRTKNYKTVTYGIIFKLEDLIINRKFKKYSIMVNKEMKDRIQYYE